MLKTLINLVTNILLFIVTLTIVMGVLLAYKHPQELTTVEGWRRFLETGELGGSYVEWRSLLRSPTFLGSLISGAVLGAITMLTGAIKNQLFLGLVGFILCVGAG